MPLDPFSPMVGTAVKASVLFVDETGVPIDPTTVTITWRAPDGTLTVNPTVTNVGVGIYTSELIVDQAGEWVVQAHGEGAVAVVEEEHFRVRENVIPL